MRHSGWGVGVCAGVAMALAVGLWACGGSDEGSDADVVSDTSGETCFQLADGRCVQETFHNPPVLQPNADGVYELELRPTEFSFSGQRHCARAYNGMYPAPTIETPAQANGQPRHVRVDYRNGFTRSAWRTLHGGECTCSHLHDGQAMSCTPEGHHDTHCTCVDADGDPCHLFDFNLTNLHAHGSHVRPDHATGGGCVETDALQCRSCNGDRTTGEHTCFFADDVLSQVGPGEGAQHRWDIDEDGVHHEGLFWYHPHIHGSTAIQVASGATGAWIVRGPVDELPGIAKARERLMVLTTPPLGYTPLAEGEPCDEDHITFDDFTTMTEPSEKQANLVNGIRQPRLVMAPGQIERWRILHGSFLDEAAIAVFRGKDSDCKSLDAAAGPIALTQIARDGLTLPRPPSGADWPFAPPYVFVSPGYRVDALLDGGAFVDGDTLCVVMSRFLQSDESGTTDQPVGFPTAPTLDEILKKLTNGDLIAIVNVTASAGPPTETAMPDLADLATHAPSMMLQDGKLDALARCAEVTAVTDIDAVDQLALLWAIPSDQDGYDACACPDHNINCENFELTDRERYPYDRVLLRGQVDHWRLQAGFDGHPFHIHINPFLVCPLPAVGSGSPNEKSRLFEPPFAHWRDTYLVNLDRTADLLTEYRAFTGDFVFHCHKLTHEDHGMMELIQICDPDTEDCATRCSGGPCGWRDCLDGDDACKRAVAASECVMDHSKCPEAALRCSRCTDGVGCPPGSTCSEVTDADGEVRCTPGCADSADCWPTDRCDAGECVGAAPCVPPCGPGSACVHGACQ
ncbi:MAG: multicopper oxidase domain-containing protein [Deltaproteobacteria bacterium]|nr:multicopper oxidase domain-containing protein [Deltaproteobacteria bacterium]